MMGVVVGEGLSVDAATGVDVVVDRRAAVHMVVSVGQLTTGLQSSAVPVQHCCSS